MVFGVLLVGQEKGVKEMEPVVHSAAKAARVGPIKIVSSSKAHEALSAVSGLGKCDVALISHHFTLIGKEQFSDALMKVLKDKYPNTVVVCWGSVEKGGKQGKDYHVGLEDMDPNALADILAKIKSGQITADWGKGKDKGKSMDKGRKSMDSADGRRKSLDSNGDAPGSPLPQAASMRRKPDGNGTLSAAPSLRRKSIDDHSPAPTSRKSISLWDDGMGGASMMNGHSDMMMGGGLSPMASMTNMGSMARTGSMTGGLAPGLTSMGSMARGGPDLSGMPMGGMGMGMGVDSMPMGNGMPAFNSMGSMAHGMSAMSNLGSMPMGNGMPAFQSMGSMAHGNGMPAFQSMGSMTGMPAMNGMGSMTGMSGMPGMGSMGGMPGMTNMGSGGGGMPMMGGMGSMGGMQPMQAMQPQPAYAMAPAPAPAAPAPAAAAASVDTAALLASLGLGGSAQQAGVAAAAAAPASADLVRMLAEEVVRLRQALDTKRRQSVDNNNHAYAAPMA